MQDRNKNKRLKFPDFFRYRRDKMSGEERNSFERELQKDLFAAEASEGFATLEPAEAHRDISDLEKHLKRRVANRQRLIVYRIAASIAVLVTVSSLLIIIERNRPPKEIAVVTDHSETLDITKSLPVTAEPDKKEFSEKPSVRIEKKGELSADIQSKKQSDLSIKEVLKSDYKYMDSTDKIDVQPINELLRSEKAAVAAPVILKEKKSSLLQAEGKVISAEDDMPVPGVSIVVKGTNSGVVSDSEGNFKITLPDSEGHTLVASFIGMETKEFEASPDTPLNIRLDPSLSSLSEVVVTGYGVRESESEPETQPARYLPPQPAGGKSVFDKYIRANLVWPDTVITGQKAVVVLNFLVHTDGSLDSIKIIKSPGKIFSNEAVRLLRAGPAWKPAEEDGKPVDEEVRLRIVFK
jgi:hypothetical protein